MEKARTPAQQQYATLKAQHEDALLLFRLGDFYELFYDDAKVAHKTLDIALTARDKSSENPVPMAGIPHHSLDRYLKKLVQAGYKVAIADQVGEVVPGKVVERAVTRVVTPGTFVSDQVASNYLASLVISQDGQGDSYHLARGDISLGTYHTQSFADMQACMVCVQNIQPTELIVAYEQARDPLLVTLQQSMPDTSVSQHPLVSQEETYLTSLLCVATTQWFGIALGGGRKSAFALLLSYVDTTQKTVPLFFSVSHAHHADHMHIDHMTMKNLEIFAASYDNNKQHSLYGRINCTKTALGARELMARLQTPSMNQTLLEQRFDRLAYFLEHKETRQTLHRLLVDTPDIARIYALIRTKKNPLSLLATLRGVLKKFLGEQGVVCKQELLRAGMSNDTLNTLVALTLRLDETLLEGQIQEDDEYIAPGINTQLDTLRQLAFHSDELLLAYHQFLCRHTWLAGLKIKFVQHQGYFVEATPKDVIAFEKHFRQDDPQLNFLRRQTLKTWERYTSTYLVDLQTKLLAAKEEFSREQHKILQELVVALSEANVALGELFSALWALDLEVHMAQFIESNQWVRPTFHDGYALEIIDGRHPVVEHFLPPHEQFIPNSVKLTEDACMHLITWPNMGGKSTFLRQNALIVLLAQAGLYVPAKQAHLPIVDGIYARIWSGDQLTNNQSTFMTEMVEMANILHNATHQSLVILDELGRGTSTYDGLALAKAIVVYMCQKLSCKTLFATHYHELIALESELPGCVNFSVGVYESDHHIVFLKKIVRGWANKSYGIDVAQLAGIPAPIVTQAKELLTALERKQTVPMQPWFNFWAINDAYKQTLDALEQLIGKLDINEITPVESLLLLQQVMKIVKEK
jgi:DNA mismatch repair protein MutS